MSTPVTTTACRRLFGTALKGATPFPATNHFEVHLFKTAVTPVIGSVPGDFTDCTFTGYAARDHVYGDNPDPVADGTFQTVTPIGSPYSWDCTAAPDTVYGWWIRDVTNDVVLFAEKYDVPHVLAVGSRHTLDLKIRFGQIG